MIILKLRGGLGNQMFQYSMGRSMELRTNIPVHYDLGTYKPGGTARRDTPRTFELNHFNTIINEATPEEIKTLTSPFKNLMRKIGAKISTPQWYKAEKRFLQPKDNSYLVGWWQTDLYFKEYADIIRKEFTLKDPLSPKAQAVADEIQQLKLSKIPTVSLHIRRGDYLTNEYANSHHGVLDLNYYMAALEKLCETESRQMHVFVFSDDIAWAMNFFKPNFLTEYVSAKSIPEYEELHLMSLCNHHVIANSTFSWWGAWLNPNPQKIVIAPKTWISENGVDTTDATPPEWIRLELVYA